MKLISVQPPKRNSVSSFETRFSLQQDNWNDYNFQTLYHLYRKNEGTEEKPSYIGSVKILKIGQTRKDGLQINEDFNKLSEEFCSVGTSLDYYQRLNELSASDRNVILSALNDVIFDSSFVKEFENEDGWKISLFRDNPDIVEFLEDAGALLNGNFSSLPDLDLDLSFTPNGWLNEIKLNFQSPEINHEQYGFFRYSLNRRGNMLPRRTIALIGRNGCGKSTLLSRIARVALASPSDRQLSTIAPLGKFDPPSVGFTRVIVISYSAFDNFIIPGINNKERIQIAHDVSSGTGRYIYSGLRDISSELIDENDIDINNENEQQAPFDLDRSPSTKLKSLDQLSKEFARMIKQIENNNDYALFEKALLPILQDSSFSDSGENFLEVIRSDKLQDAFIGWSTGHKIVLHVISSIVAHSVRKSLVLFDEPETHLHPPLIAALMRSIRIVLEEKNAFAIVATHSPVILQETLSEHVLIIRRNGDQIEVQHPSIQTFGENVGTLTQDVFGLTNEKTDFHDTLDLLIKNFDTIEEINEIFGTKLNGQALAYVLSGLARKVREK